MSSTQQEFVLNQIREQLNKNKAKAAVEDAPPVQAEEMFKDEGNPAAGANQVMFSKLFFDPSTIGLEDFPVDTFFHLHEEWPEEVVGHVPQRDENYVWNKDITYAFLISDDDHAFLVGDPGTGKTTLPQQVAALTGRPVLKVSFSSDLERDEWVESKEIDENGTRWNELPFMKSLEYPYYVVLDEFNRLRRGGRLLMNRLLDEGGTMQSSAGYEKAPHPLWRACATDNTRGLGDKLDKFDGDVSDISTTDRFGVMIEVPYLTAADQKQLVKNWYPTIDQRIVDGLVAFGGRIATAYSNDDIALPWTPRRMQKAAKLSIKYRNLTQGLKSSYYGFLADDAERKLANQVLKDLKIDKTFGEFA